MPRRIYLMLAAVLAACSGSEGRNSEEADFGVYADQANGGQERYCHCGRGARAAQEWIAHVQRFQSNRAPEHLQEGKDNSKRLWEKLLAGFWKHDGDSEFVRRHSAEDLRGR